MNIKSHSQIKEKLLFEYRDIAFIASPGMGLSTFLESLKSDSGLSVVWIDNKTLGRFWETEYKNRPKNKRYVIHAATINAFCLSEYNVNLAKIGETEIFSFNLPVFLKKYTEEFRLPNPLYIVMDAFDKIEPDLAIIICNELKALDDFRSKEGFEILQSIRFIIGGAIDFSSLYKLKSSRVSPATNFCKFRPYEFLLSPSETKNLVKERFPSLAESSYLVDLIVDWTSGYLHYVLAFSNWILSRIDRFKEPPILELVSELKMCIEEQDRLEIYEYCNKNWNLVKANDVMMDLLAIALSAGIVSDLGENSRKLANWGFLLELPGTRGVYSIPNRLIELFIRQRLAEKDRALPLEETLTFMIPSINSAAFLLILEIETRLRNFIGDKLFMEFKDQWIEKGFNVERSNIDIPLDDATEQVQGKENGNDKKISTKNEKKTNIKKSVKALSKIEKRSYFTPEGLSDPASSFLEFSDLGILVSKNSSAFSSAFVKQLPIFIQNLKYYRNRIAHNRPIMPSQVNDIEQKWKQIQRMMIFVGKNNT